jgi:UDP-glucose 4-epimerase
MKVLVTGGTGFIGSFVVEKLLEKGHDVCIVAIGRELPEYIRKIRDQITFHQADYGDVDSLNKILPGCDAVIHLAWSTVPKQTRGTTGFEFSSNVISSITLLEKCIDFNIGKFVFISSGGTIYGIPDHIPIAETHEQKPISGYGLSKLTMEKLLHIYHHAQGINYSVLRVSNAYGERQNYIKNQGVISVWIRNIFKKGEIEIWGDGSVIRDYVYVKDVADAIVNALEKTNGSSVYNIGGGKGYSLNDLLDELKKISKTPFKVTYKPSRNFDVPVNILDITEASKNLGYKPTTSLSEGIRKTYAWMEREMRR